MKIQVFCFTFLFCIFTDKISRAVFETRSDRLAETQLFFFSMPYNNMVNAYQESKYVSPLQIRSYADLVSNLNSHIKAVVTDTVIRLSKNERKCFCRIHFSGVLRF